MRRMKWSRALLRLIGACSGIVGALTILLACNESRLPFEDGRYFDGISVHLEQSIEAYVAVAVVSLIFAILAFWSARNLMRP
jgi:hypothetical protein